MRANEFNLKIFNDTWEAINKELAIVEEKEGLPAVFELLNAQQTNIGFIQDDLDLVDRHFYAHPQDESKFFTVQYNPKRANRFDGAGRTIPPKNAVPVHHGCFLCRENVQWQQYGKELGYDFSTKSSGYTALMNPYPLMPQHAVLVSDRHIPQALPFMNGGDHLETIIKDMVELAVRLPGYVGFYNGEGAGASIPGHLHLQFFTRPAGYTSFPLESAAKAHQGELPCIIDDYPVFCAYWKSSPEDIIQQAFGPIKQWMKGAADKSNISANIFTTQDAVDGDIHLYFVPRNQMLSHSQETADTIGGLEILGELVFSSNDEKHRLDCNEMDYHTIERVLSAVRVSADIRF